MELKYNFKFINCVGHHTLLYGETDSRKTYLTAKFIEFLINSENVNPDDISILDFAPPLNYFNNIKIGGKIKDFSKLSLQCRNIPLKGEIIPPRFTASNKKQLYDYLCHNYRITSLCIKSFEEDPTNYLIVNDISIYLHLGNKSTFLILLNSVGTFFGNAYYGNEIKSNLSKLISLKERKRVEFLIKNIDYPISTS
jgi:hypothetical protein